MPGQKDEALWSKAKRAVSESRNEAIERVRVLEVELAIAKARGEKP